MEKWLKLHMRKIIKRYWGMDCEIPIHINGRLKKTLGRYLYETEQNGVIPIAIELSKEMIEHANKRFILLILKHEVCHYILSIKDLPFLDGDDVFEQELIRIGSLSTKEMSIEYRVQCTRCQRVYRCKNNQEAKKIEKKGKSKCCSADFLYGGIHYEVLKR